MTKTYRLTGADGRAYDSPVAGALGGNRRAKIYGRLDCRSATRALPGYARHRVFFADEATAVAAGFRPCAKCMPAEYAVWKGRREAVSSGSRDGAREPPVDEERRTTDLSRRRHPAALHPRSI